MNSLHDYQLSVIIVDDKGKQACDAGCGTDWSLSEAVSLLEERIKEKFNDKIVMEYVDLSKGGNSQQKLDWHRLIEDNSLPVPLLLVDGELRMSGQFDIRQILDAIEVHMEIKRYAGE